MHSNASDTGRHRDPPFAAVDDQRLVTRLTASVKIGADSTIGTRTQTAEQDRRSRLANAPDLFSFGDQVAADLALQISESPEIRDSPTRVVIEFGTLSNQTATPTSDFELIQRRLRNALQQSRHLQKYAMFVETRQRMEREHRNIRGAEEPDLLQEGSTSAAPARYDPNITFVLQGDFYEMRRGGARRYYFDFQLTNLASRATVFADTFEQGYR